MLTDKQRLHLAAIVEESAAHREREAATPFELLMLAVADHLAEAERERDQARALAEAAVAALKECFASYEAHAKAAEWNLGLVFDKDEWERRPGVLRVRALLATDAARTALARREAEQMVIEAALEWADWGPASFEGDSARVLRATVAALVAQKEGK